MIDVGIIGATGYVGLELIRLLYSHPHVNIKSLVSSSSAGSDFSKYYQGFTGSDLPVLEEYPGQECDVYFTSLPHGASSDIVSNLHSTGKIVIDMSGDYRYDDAKIYEQWYKVTHPHPELLSGAVYGLPELYRDEIKKATLIGNPGCYTTCSILALAPLYKHKLIDPASSIIDAKSGVTGAGKKASEDVHYCEVNESLKAYNIAKHRHTSEIEQELGKLFGETHPVSFTPHLVPLSRGILATCYANLTCNVDEKELFRLYNEFYSTAPFVRIVSDAPQIKHVALSNFCNIGFVVDSRTNRIIVISCIDNLIKGAAGQAIQNMNIIFGLDEKTGLNFMPRTI